MFWGARTRFRPENKSLLAHLKPLLRSGVALAFGNRPLVDQVTSISRPPGEAALRLDISQTNHRFLDGAAMGPVTLFTLKALDRSRVFDVKVGELRTA